MTTAPERDLDQILLASHARRYTRRMRMRVGVAMSVVLMVVALLFGFLSALAGNWALMTVDLLTGALAGACMYLFRRGRGPTLPSALLLGWMLLGNIGMGLTAEGLPFVTSIWAGLLALLSLYLLGPRHGAIFVAVLLLGSGAVWAVHQSGITLPHVAMARPRWTPLFSGVGVGLIGLLGYLYEAAQKRSLGELADALIASEQNERQLDALFESTTSAICSLDRDLRLLTCNRSFADLLPPGAPLPVAGEALQRLLPPEQYARWQGPIERVLAGHSGPTTFEESPLPGQDGAHRETIMHPLMSGDRVIGVTVFSRDISARKRAEAEMRRLNQELVRVSRQAGMAVVAGEVLHNAGNVLNSTGVSVSMIDRHVKNLRTGHLTRLAALVDEHADKLETFLRDDSRGKRVPDLLRALAEHFEQQQAQLGAEVTALQSNIEHFIRVIYAQQSHARGLGIVETVSVAELVDAVLDLQAASGSQLGIVIEREIGDVPLLHIDKHKVIEILVNLISNARHSLRDSGRPDKRLRIRAEVVAAVPAGDVGPDAGAGRRDAGAGRRDAGAGERVRIHVEDNGLGIASEHREKLFRLGFTTKREGSGIGLHSSANAAQQLGGSLSFHSDGPGRGATFTLELPVGEAAGPDAGPDAGPSSGPASGLAAQRASATQR
jgi:two-component system sensor kinase FixL